LGRGPVAGAQPRALANAFWGMKTPKMHILSINFISFTAQLYNALHMQSKKATLASWGHGPFASLNPPVATVAYS